jgi:hypothetical protein
MKRVIHSICAGLLCICWTFAAFGQQPTKSTASVPRVVKFSGTLVDGGGKPLTGVAGVTFSLYEEPDGGAPIWMETQNVQADGNGHYTAMLGSTRNDGIPAEVFASGQGRWLGVQPQGETERPRVLLTSVPYALKAVDAETLGGLPASAFALAGTTATTPEHGVVAGVAQSEAAASIKTAVKPLFTTTGTTNYIAKFTDTSGDVANSVMYQNGSNIGVGTTAAAISMDVRPTATSPYAQLGVAQMVDYMTLFASDTYGPAFYWDPTKALRLGKGGTGLYNAQGFVEYMRIQPNGYVGIGTETPTATLDVMGNINSSGMFLIGENPVLSTSVSSANLFVGAQNGQQSTGVYNVFIGTPAGNNTTSGIFNTFVGADTGVSNTTGGSNVFLGHGAGGGNSTGYGNTFAGESAGPGNGNYNTFVGQGAGGGFIGTASQNTVVGAQAGGFGSPFGATGGSNTFMGYQSGWMDTSGNANVFVGYESGGLNTTGDSNVFVGSGAGSGTTTGSNNIFIGQGAGVDNSTGSYDIYVGNFGPYPDESDTIRIGQPTVQTSAYIAGVYGVTTSASNAVQVLIDSNGNLGTMSSSRRYKEDIQDMGDSSSGLLRLRPVTFRYRKPFDDGSKPVQYGLIAEEVAEVYPDLVARSADGQIETVKYQLLDPMLLNELQKQSATIAAQKEQIRSQEQRISSLEERLARVEAALGGATVTAAAR